VLEGQDKGGNWGDMLGADKSAAEEADVTVEVRHRASLLKTGALPTAMFKGANLSGIALETKGRIRILNVGGDQMPGYTAAEVMNEITLAEISDSGGRSPARGNFRRALPVSGPEHEPEP
jgi:hypothetical protein